MERLAVTAKKALELGIYTYDKIVHDAHDLISRAHTLGVIHRDLHADNMMYDDSGKLSMIDLGTAIQVDPHDQMYEYLKVQDTRKFLRSLTGRRE